ncbi:MAG: nucleotide exchange factor GrpE [Eubacteriales bacterium]|nr:nucleotide exchange factor GrpE [Eubacteriales bacterium]
MPKDNDANTKEFMAQEIWNEFITDVLEIIRKKRELEQEKAEKELETENKIKKLLLRFIEVSDSFENVFKNIDPVIGEADSRTQSWVSNFSTIYNMLQRALKECGVVPAETLTGSKASPYWHNVIETVSQSGFEDETIVEEIKKGYLFEGKLIRMADVKAVRNL